jgi:tetratricopeptide (TPR) repeat protein
MLSETPMQLDQIETWQRALEEGRSLTAEATGLQAEAKQAQALRHWNEAAEKFRQARAIYDSARTKLEVPAAIDANSYRALRALRDEASEVLKQAQDALAEHERARWVELCERNIIVALEMQQQAQTALYEGNLDAARTLAIQARDMHPALREEAERTMRAAVERAGENGGMTSAIILVAIVAVLIGLIIGAGPQLWHWIAG